MTTKSELAAAVAEQIGITKEDARRAVGAAFDIMANRLAEGGRVHVAGFGVFSVKATKARTGRNPRTGAEVGIPAGRAVKFKPAVELKGRV